MRQKGVLYSVRARMYVASAVDMNIASRTIKVQQATRTGAQSLTFTHAVWSGTGHPPHTDAGGAPFQDSLPLPLSANATAATTTNNMAVSAEQLTPQPDDSYCNFSFKLEPVQHMHYFSTCLLHFRAHTTKHVSRCPPHTLLHLRSGGCFSCTLSVNVVQDL